MGWTITAAADMLNVTRGTYRRWEKGEVTPNPHHQRDYCDLLSAFRDAINGGDREKPGGT
jgi:DNA-binding XRE family transcriptional regulator